MHPTLRLFISYRRHDHRALNPAEMIREELHQKKLGRIPPGFTEEPVVEVYLDSIDGVAGDVSDFIRMRVHSSDILLLIASSGVTTPPKSGPDWVMNELAWWDEGHHFNPPLVVQTDTKDGRDIPAFYERTWPNQAKEFLATADATNLKPEAWTREQASFFERLRNWIAGAATRELDNQRRSAEAKNALLTAELTEERAKCGKLHETVREIKEKAFADAERDRKNSEELRDRLRTNGEASSKEVDSLRGEIEALKHDKLKLTDSLKELQIYRTFSRGLVVFGVLGLVAIGWAINAEGRAYISNLTVDKMAADPIARQLKEMVAALAGGASSAIAELDAAKARAAEVLSAATANEVKTVVKELRDAASATKKEIGAETGRLDAAVQEVEKWANSMLSPAAAQDLANAVKRLESALTEIESRLEDLAKDRIQVLKVAPTASTATAGEAANLTDMGPGIHVEPARAVTGEVLTESGPVTSDGGQIPGAGAEGSAEPMPGSVPPSNPSN